MARFLTVRDLGPARPSLPTASGGRVAIEVGYPDWRTPTGREAGGTDGR